MIRKSLFAAAACMISLSVFGATLSVPDAQASQLVTQPATATARA